MYMMDKKKSHNQESNYTYIYIFTFVIKKKHTQFHYKKTSHAGQIPVVMYV